MRGATIARTLVGSLLLLVSAGLAQDPTGTTSALGTLTALAAKNQQKEIASFLQKRGGDTLDIMAAAVSAEGSGFAAAKAILPLLPEPERAGATRLFADLEKATPDMRAAFVAACGALSAAEVTITDPRANEKTIAAAIDLAREKGAAAKHTWISARVAFVTWFPKVGADLAGAEPELKGAVENLAEYGDRFNQAVAQTVWSKALLDAGRGPEAVRAREAAQEAVSALKTSLDRPGLVPAVLARVDLILAETMFNEGWDEPALTAAQRAAAVFKSYDPLRDLQATVVFAWLMIERRSFAAVIEAFKPHQARLKNLEQPGLLVRASTAYATALRMSGKPQAAVAILKDVLVKSKQLNATAIEELPARFAIGLAYAQSNQSEAAMASFEGLARQASDAQLPAIARAAVLNRALISLAAKREEEATKIFARAVAMSAGGPTLDRIQAAGSYLAWAELMIAAQKPQEAMKWFKDGAAVAEELGVTVETLKGPTGTVVAPSKTSMQQVFAAAVSGNEIGKDFASIEPAFAAAEQLGFEACAKVVADEAVEPELQRQADEARRQFTRLMRGFAGLRPLITEEQCATLLRERHALIEGVWDRKPSFAMKQFPRMTTVARARSHFCGPDGAILDIVLTPSGAVAFAFSRYRFHAPQRIISEIPLADAIDAFNKVVKNPRSTPGDLTTASAPIWSSLIQPMWDVLDGRKWLAVYADPKLDDFPIECLVPPDAKTGSWGTMPFLMNTVAVCRVPTVSRAPAVRDRRPTAWLTAPWLGAVHAGNAAEMLPTVHSFETEVTAEQLRGAKAALLSAEEYGALLPRTESLPAGRFPNGSALWFGPGVPPKAYDWAASSTPDVVVASDPLAPQFPGDNLTLRLLARGARAVIAPQAKVDRALAMLVGNLTLTNMIHLGLPPAEALAEAKKTLAGGTAKGIPPANKEAWSHPSAWTPIMAWIVAP